MAFQLFKKKKKEEPPAPAPLPTDYIASLRAQGYTDEQIVSFMQQQGWSPQQVYDALASLAPSAPEPYVTTETTPSPPKIEETVETVIEEKWASFKEELSKLNEWREEVNSRLDKLEQSIQDLKSDVDGLHKAVVSKIAEYDKSLLDVGTEIKAMEKIFSKVLPEFTSSVQELGRIARKEKRGSKASKA